MKKLLFLALSLVVAMTVCRAENEVATADSLPSNIFSGEHQNGHIQGIAYDKAGGYMYCSFTTVLVKTDMKGNIIGTVEGLVGHLGCIAYNYDDGKVYGSLEFKNDCIGAGILAGLGLETKPEEGFYMTIFDFF